MRNKLGWILAVALVLASPLFAFDRQDFDRIADFSVTIKTLAGLSGAGALSAACCCWTAPWLHAVPEAGDPFAVGWTAGGSGSARR
jgi:hypothetical protein